MSLRVLHVSDVYLPRLGGLEMQVHDLTLQQARAGHDVRLVTATSELTGRISQWAADVGPPGVDVLRTGRAVGVSWHEVLEHRPDVVHCHVSVVSPMAWSAARAATRAGLPVVVTMHSMLSPSGAVATLWRYIASAVGEVTWTAVSHVAASSLSQVIQAPVAVLPNGIDPGQWTHATPAGQSIPTIVAVMRLARRKRAVELIDVLAALRDRTPGVPWRAVIAGDGPGSGAVRRAVRRHDLQERTSLVGRLTRPEVARLLAASDVFVAPAHLESFGIAALEARCAGLPVVAMRHGGVAEFVSDGRDGYLVGSDEELTARLAELVRDLPALRQMGVELRRRPVPLAWPLVVRNCDRVYAEAGAGPAPKARESAAGDHLAFSML
ncbi:MAG TPA: glycosyltransferase family 4 protein [Marmoricola sp.]|nr:glycosyltransferase family 4 protein [Marmoricola sp.]